MSRKPRTFLLMLLLSPWAEGLVAQTPAERELAVARTTYEQAMAEVRKQVLAEIGAAKADVKVRQDWRDRFRETGEWPKIEGNTRLGGLQGQVAGCLQALHLAYEKCLEGVFDEAALAKVVRAEWDQWHRLADLPSWQPLTPASARGGEAPELLALFEPKGPYRLEIRGSCQPDSTPLLLVPGQARPFAVLHDKGQFRVLLTVGPDTVAAADLGLRRGEVAGAAAPRVGKEVALLAASCTIELLQWKPAPLDVERLARDGAARLEKAAADSAQAESAARSAVARQVAALERKKRDPATRLPGIESRLATAEQNVTKLAAQVDRERARGRDTSDLETDLRSWRGKAAEHRKTLEQLRAEIARIDDEIARLGKQ